MATVSDSFDVPFRDQITEGRGFLSQAWTGFFRSVLERLSPLGIERSYPLANNQSSPADIVGLKVNSRAVSQAVVEYLIQRITTGGSATTLIESGILILTYNLTNDDWTISQLNSDLPSDSGIDFAITAAGQVTYESSNIAGTPSISRIVWRMRTLAGKSAQYSSQGAR